ncbi:bifunctional [glutamine synthetase] adenylyltransferase/[glutamine synthetase]-adenylyl-L-tyrosine phosphorylase [Pseudovibrio exalbescens]|uniref:bifunctional [glutamine synthetase] adenylyltransferase/[glutamine synthetase]-adenylyl-L-tyrosine phosphorylase n=1 Tax=Pseudovibrio exalbescens TaxID=197461 RepID=UPI0023655755|nr:bifunctional [glutamine synthetase] adenylyltransferase/[glutamine synthetase]-adenylyl-L-tyrosine phosphorylase [Pseudovibrio exalbescens]MDD7909121.1 bifunctional [glutamine synthetase] adenylyltransferase/[glutamine synthetase]-adenylyl-L-tyrosine phosphorylase [Pseudovibrio exalbescens]
MTVAKENSVAHPLEDQSCLAERLEVIPVADDTRLAEAHWKDVELALEKAGIAEAFQSACDEYPKLKSFLTGVFVNSPFLKEISLRDVERLLRILTSSPEAIITDLCLHDAYDHATSEADLMRVLRLAKQELALTTALADLGGVWPLEMVTGALSDFADVSLNACIRLCYRDLQARSRFEPVHADRPEKDAGFFILAMGKHGAGELNYSSDIDLIVFYEPELSRLQGNAEPPVEYVRMTRRIVKMMSERTGDGYVFRTDLRLRPDPGATPLAISVPAALVYYESLGQNWERAALIKARPCAGDVAAGEIFLKEIRPFIWRKYLDYAAISDVHSIKRQIHAHKGFGKITVAGHNVKLGRGGIREVEFFAQTQQLIAGGRNPDLRTRQTLVTLQGLVEHGWIDPSACEELAEAYTFLRNVEHRIQMVNDEQTHILPTDPDALARVYKLLGLATLEEFTEALLKRFNTVQDHYSALFENEPELTDSLGNLVFTGDSDDPDTVATLERLGFKRPSEAIRIIREWHYGRYPAMRTAKSRERLTELHPVLLDALAKTDNADSALLSFNAFLSKLPAGVQLFGLLRSNPHLLNLLATVMGSAPRMAEIVSRRVHVLDAVLDPAFFGDVPTQAQIVSGLETTLGQARFYEEALDRARIFVQEQQFLLGLRLLTDSITPLQMGECLSYLAQAVLQQMLARVQAELEETHGQLPGAEVALLAMGKLGGREITCSSDLDLILLYEVPEEVYESDGGRPLAPSQYFGRLTQRLVSALTAPTAEGVLFEVDFRLRPSGNSGPLATRFSAFTEYQQKEAWTWEHMALTRARVIASNSDSFSMRIERGIEDIKSGARDLEKLRKDVCEMRARIQKEKPAKCPWDLKQVSGGLVDIEFIAQYLQLAHGKDHPQVLKQKTEQALQAAVSAGVLDQSHADVLVPQLRLYEALTQILKLTLSGKFDPNTAPRGMLDLLVMAGGEPTFERLTRLLEDQQVEVRRCFEDIIGPVTLAAAG